MATYETLWRKRYYPNPFPDDFYSGNTSFEDYGMGQPENYYSFEWGDALFVVIDAWRYYTASVKPRNWDWTIGKTQYDWLKQTLETSTAKYKFVFCHHVMGETRGGIAVATGFEWGGMDNGTNKFAINRPGWAMPIHQLMVANHVNIFFQGHDHLYARESLDSLVYQDRKGLGVVVLDEYFRPGGRLTGQLYENPAKPPGQRLWDGRALAEKLSKDVLEAGARIISGVSAWNISPSGEVYITGDCQKIEARAVLIATGASERAMPVEGWTIPGVMSAGAAQVFANVHGVLPGRKVVMVGIDPLSITVAGELKKAGAEVLGIFLPPPGLLAGKMAMPPEVIGNLSRSADLAPGTFLKMAGKIFGGSYRGMGARLCSLSNASIWGIPLHLRRAVVRAEGDEQVRAVVTARISHDGAMEGEDCRLDVDAVCLSGGLYPLTDLVSAAGCPLVSMPGLGGRIPLHGPLLQTPVRGLFVAGNVTGVEGAPVAMAQGHLAGVSIASFLGKLRKDHLQDLEGAMEQVERAREESPLKFYPGAAGARKEMAFLWEQWKAERMTGGNCAG